MWQKYLHKHRHSSLPYLMSAWIQIKLIMTQVCTFFHENTEKALKKDKGTEWEGKTQSGQTNVCSYERNQPHKYSFSGHFPPASCTVCVGGSGAARAMGKGMFPPERIGGAFACLHIQKNDAHQDPKGLINELSNRNWHLTLLKCLP